MEFIPIGFTFKPEEHKYFLNGRSLPSVTQILDRCALIKGKRWFTDENRERGQKVHELIHYHDKGTLDIESIDLELQPYYDAFVNFLNETKFEPYYIEEAMYSENPLFAGKPDRIGLLDGVTTLIDFKTGGWYPHYDLQLAGYAILAERHLKLSIKKRFVIQLMKTGKWKKIEPAIPNDIANNLFRKCVDFIDVLDWMENHG